MVAGVARYGLFFLLPASGPELLLVGMERPTPGDLLGLLYLGGAASALAFVLWGHGLSLLEAAQATVFANLNPLVGLVVAALLLGEPVTSTQLGGGLLIGAGVWAATINPALPSPGCGSPHAQSSQRPTPRETERLLERR